MKKLNPCLRFGEDEHADGDGAVGTQIGSRKRTTTTGALRDDLSGNVSSATGKNNQNAAGGGQMAGSSKNRMATNQGNGEKV